MQSVLITLPKEWIDNSFVCVPVIKCQNKALMVLILVVLLLEVVECNADPGALFDHYTPIPN